MRDWKVFRPESGGSGAPSTKHQQEKRPDPSEPVQPQFEIALDMNAEQLTLMFDDTVKYEERSSHTPIDSSVDHQEAWRREGLRPKVDIAESFGMWATEARLDGSKYYRKVTRLGL